MPIVVLNTEVCIDSNMFSSLCLFFSEGTPKFEPNNKNK